MGRGIIIIIITLSLTIESLQVCFPLAGMAYTFAEFCCWVCAGLYGEFGAGGVNVKEEYSDPASDYSSDTCSDFDWTTSRRPAPAANGANSASALTDFRHGTSSIVVVLIAVSTAHPERTLRGSWSLLSDNEHYLGRARNVVFRRLFTLSRRFSSPAICPSFTNPAFSIASG